MVKAIFDVISFIFELLSLVLISACFYRLQIKITMCRITAVMASVIGVFSFSLITGLVETSIITVGVSVLCAFVMLERKKNYLKFISALLLLIIIEMELTPVLKDKFNKEKLQDISRQMTKATTQQSILLLRTTILLAQNSTKFLGIGTKKQEYI